MADPAQIVKRFTLDLEESVLKMEPGERAERRHETVVALKAVLKENRELKRLTAPLPNTLGDLSELPEELLEELTITNVGELDSQIYTVINASEGRKADLDAILVGLWRKFGVVQKRRPLGNKLWRMTQKEDGTIWATPDAKGTYQTTDPDKEKPKSSGGMPIVTLHPKAPSILDSSNPPFELDDEIPF